MEEARARRVRHPSAGYPVWPVGAVGSLSPGDYDLYEIRGDGNSRHGGSSDALLPDDHIGAQCINSVIAMRPVASNNLPSCLFQPLAAVNNLGGYLSVA